MVASSHGPERALRERRERADAFDLVAEELDPQRLATGRGEDVDQTATDGELAALLDALDALVAGEREPLGQLLEARLVAGPEAERLGPLTCGRQPLGDRFRRGADETSPCEDVERARALADEVRRRLEPRSPADAAAREEGDVLRPEEPACGLGRVARVGIVGKQADERPLELLVQRRKDERQDRLGDARARRQGLGEALEALVRAERVDECVQHRPVHDERRDSRPARLESTQRASPHHPHPGRG